MDVGFLEERFLSADRSRLEAARIIAREEPDPGALMARFAREGWLSQDFLEGGDRRWYRLGPSRRDDPGGVSLETGNGLMRRVHRLPSTAEHACFVATDAAKMVDAERWARAFAHAVWRVTGADGPAPDAVVWRVSAWGSAPPHSWPHLHGVVEASKLPAWDGRNLHEYTGAFAWVANLLSWRRIWDERRSKGEVPDVDLWGPLIEVWATGLGFSGLTESAIVLFHPPKAPPTRQAALLPEPNQVAVATEELQRALQNADPHRMRSALVHRPPIPVDALEQLTRTGTYSRPPEAALITRVTDCVRALLEAGAPPWGRAGERNDLPPLAISACTDRYMPTRAFVDGGLDVDTTDPRGRTALHHLARAGHAAGCEVLLGLGADPNARDELGWSPAHHALWGGHAYVLRALEAAGARFDLATGNGRTPAELVERLPVDARAAVERWVQPVGAAPALIPGMIVVPPAALCEAVREAREQAWTVLGDWMAERGDPRGTAVALAAAGRPAEADIAGRAGAARVRRALVGVHPGVEAMFADRSVIWRWEHGFVRGLELFAGSSRHLPSLVALLGSRHLALVRQIDVLDGGNELLDALAGVRATVPAVLRMARVDGPRSMVDLAGLSGLRGLALQGHGLRSLDLRHPTVRRLAIELPYLKALDLPPLVDRLEMPALEALSVTFHGPPGGTATAWIAGLAGRSLPRLRSLALRPATDAAIEALIGGRMLPALEHLWLDSCFGTTVQRVLVSADQFEHLRTLAFTVVRQEAAERRRLIADLQQVLPNATLQGIGFRGVNGYGDRTHSRGALGTWVL